MRRRPEGWVPPGPVPPGAEAPWRQPGPGETLDCLAGHWRIFQLRRGHRYSTDDLLTAWYAAREAERSGVTPGRCLDLGCGIGSVGLLLLWKFPRLRFVGVEAQEISAALARRSIAYNGAADRAEIRAADFRDPAALRPGEAFDVVTGSPPYLTAGEGRRSPLPQRGPCRFEDRGGAQAYLEVAGERLVERGFTVWVHASRHREGNLEASRSAGLGRIRLRPVLFREGRQSLITLFCARRGPPEEPVEDEPLVVRTRSGAWSQQYRQVRREMGFPV
ncbi:MAG: tRNA1(Val) (adenine(37)-N6)-methyltransferase [Deferrisomatales bacterium]